MQVNPYLMFDGQCEAAFKFYAEVLGGKIEAMMTHEGSPMEAQVSPEWHKKIMHARLSIGDEVLMASDAPPDHYEPMKGFSVTLSIDSPAEAERVFRALSAGAKAVTMPIQETFWAQRFGMLTDKFGTPWMINCEKAAH
ncbi:MAG TPA: VOC family protein [Stellaceae bacterium]|nr:VOC family protein [Stellaceae bacterium]